MKPMLAVAAATAGDLPADGHAWAYEVKWDGVRVLAQVREGAVRLHSRAGNDVTLAYPELVEGPDGLGAIHPEVLLDGEVVVLREGTPSFAAIAERMHVRDPRRARELAARAPATFVVFDVLGLDGHDLTDRPWQQRRDLLERLAPDGPHCRLSPVFTDRDALVAATVEQGLEGVVAKRRAARYTPGGRTGDWVKLAHRRSQSCLVGGWRWESTGRHRIGALLLGVWSPEPGALVYVGRAGSGISAALEAQLREALEPLRRERSPFATAVPAVDAAGACWVRPELVVEVEYLARSEAGRLRMPVVRGVRADLPAGEVREE